MNLEIMNNTLLAKWMVKYKDITIQVYSKDILRFKYHTVVNKMKFSIFWKDVHSISEVVDFYLNR
jgi:hypothetical protein